MSAASVVRRKRVRLDSKRNDVATLIWALDDVIENAKHDGGLCLVEDEIRLRERLDARLRRFDLGR